MKKLVLSILALSLFALSPIQAEEVSPVDQAIDAAAATEVAPTEDAAVTVDADTAAQAAEAETIDQENLEFISGEISSVDEVAKTVSVKLYGETEEDANDKVISIKLDENTDITDGEKDRDIKSLTQGTEVDVEYDPASNMATYIFVY